MIIAVTNVGGKVISNRKYHDDSVVGTWTEFPTHCVKNTLNEYFM